MEREVILTGLGGQGIQLAAQVLARAAITQGRSAMMLGTYLGAMRGGNSDATVVVADSQVLAPPIISRTWSAVALHHEHWPAVAAKVEPGGVILLNTSLFDGEVDRQAHRVFDVPATAIADEVGDPMAASMVLCGALAALTGLVGVDEAVAAMVESLPPYRRQHAALNEAALRAGADAVPALAAPAWETEAVAAGARRP